VLIEKALARICHNNRRSMENKLPLRDGTSIQLKPSSSPGVSNTSQRSSVFSHFFQGRLNRRSYFFGHILVGIGIITLTPFMPIIGVFLGAEATTLMGIAFSSAVIAIFYSISFTARRLHDLNKSGLLPLIYLPAYLIFLLNLWPVITGSNAQYMIFSSPPLSHLYSLYNIVITVFIIYLLFWPG